MFSGIKKIGCWFNSPYLGGAERSFVHQLSRLQTETKTELTAFIPEMGTNNTSLLNELNERSIEHHLVSYSNMLFSFSRSSQSSFIKLFLLPFAILKTMKNAKKAMNGQFDAHWVNGNKIGFVLFLLCKIMRFKGTLIWHLRDYPTDKKPYDLIWKLLSRDHCFKLMIVSNSKSVDKKAKKIIKGCHVQFHVLYNFMGETRIKSREAEQVLTIGAASMYAPWKGLHEIIIMAGLYNNELKDLGIKKISLYGGSLYKTEGTHKGYEQQLNDLKKSMNAELIFFEGKERPEIIYKNIDVLIHSSIKKEPFGRILIEALSAGIPVVSTALGGAGEIILNQKTGLVYQRGDYSSLFYNLKNIITNKTLRISLKKQGLEKFHELDHLAKKQFDEICRKLDLEILDDGEQFLKVA